MWPTWTGGSLEEHSKRESISRSTKRDVYSLCSDWLTFPTFYVGHINDIDHILRNSAQFELENSPS